MRTQREQIEELLITGEWISTAEFLKRFISRGASIICTLRKEDWRIVSRQVEGKSYNEYKLITPPRIPRLF